MHMARVELRAAAHRRVREAGFVRPAHAIGCEGTAAPASMNSHKHTRRMRSPELAELELCVSPAPRMLAQEWLFSLMI